MTPRRGFFMEKNRKHYDGNANLTMYKHDCLKLYSFSHCLRATLHGETGMIALLGGASY